jgi:hypothetical protein
MKFFEIVRLELSESNHALVVAEYLLFSIAFLISPVEFEAVLPVCYCCIVLEGVVNSCMILMYFLAD